MIDFIPARKILEILTKNTTAAALLSAADLSQLGDLAQECKMHFEDGRKTVAFVMQVVFEGLEESEGRLSQKDSADYHSLRIVLRSCAQNLIEPGVDASLLRECGELVDASERWLG